MWPTWNLIECISESAGSIPMSFLLAMMCILQSQANLKAFADSLWFLWFHIAFGQIFFLIGLLQKQLELFHFSLLKWTVVGDWMCICESPSWQSREPYRLWLALNANGLKLRWPPYNISASSLMKLWFEIGVPTFSFISLIFRSVGYYFQSSCLLLAVLSKTICIFLYLNLFLLVWISNQNSLF